MGSWDSEGEVYKNLVGEGRETGTSIGDERYDDNLQRKVTVVHQAFRVETEACIETSQVYRHVKTHKDRWRLIKRLEETC